MNKEICKCLEFYEEKSRTEKVEYVAVEEMLYCEELSSTYRTYGIAAVQNGERIAFVSDASPDRASVEELVRRCNKYSLDPIHLIDVVEDLLVQ